MFENYPSTDERFHDFQHHITSLERQLISMQSEVHRMQKEGEPFVRELHELVKKNTFKESLLDLIGKSEICARQSELEAYILDNYPQLMQKNQEAMDLDTTIIQEVERYLLEQRDPMYMGLLEKNDEKGRYEYVLAMRKHCYVSLCCHI